MSLIVTCAECGETIYDAEANAWDWDDDWYCERHRPQELLDFLDENTDTEEFTFSAFLDAHPF